MMKIIRRNSGFLGLLILAALLIGSIAGCGSGPGKGEGKVVLRFSTWESAGEGMNVLQKIIDRFEAKYPHIKVKVEQVPGGGYSGKILTQIAGGQAPDVINIAFQTGDLPVYVEKGALLNLEALAKADPKFNKKDYFPNTIRAASYKGELYALPKDGNPYILYYNKNLFDQAGIAYPDKNWTWDDLLKASRKLTRYDKKGRVITLGGGYNIYQYYTLIVQNGGRIFSKDGKKCLMDSPRALEALRYALTFSREGLVPSPKASSLTGIASLDLFPTGRMAMWIFMPYRLGDAVKRIKGFKWDIAPIPIPKGGKRFSGLIHVGYAISSTTKHPQEAWDFISYLSGPVGQTMMARLKYGVPSIKSIAYSDNYGPPPAHIRVAVEAMEYSELFPPLPSSREIRALIGRKLDEVINGLEPLDQAVKEIVRGVNNLLNR